MPTKNNNISFRLSGGVNLRVQTETEEKLQIMQLLLASQSLALAAEAVEGFDSLFKIMIDS